MLPKKYKLPAKDFRYVYSKGLKFRGQYGMLVALASSSTPKFGFVLNKKVGNAVQRHRMTRLLRVIVMELVQELELDYLLILIFVGQLMMWRFKLKLL
ncbi:MAG: ribonuclease P protein component [Clostridiales bacterium]|nr:ribonuclease P protein component [Clostridiales bacterium]